MKALEIKSEVLFPRDINDGDICKVIFHPNPLYKGLIVQRYKDTFVTLGKSSGDAFIGWCISDNSDIELEILPKGTTLEI